MARKKLALPLLLSAVALAACGTDDGGGNEGGGDAGGGDTGGGGNLVEPAIIEGGGAGGGAIDGRVNVYVIDEDTDEPLTAATVLIGTGEATGTIGTTDATGLAQFNSADLQGAQTISAWADGYRGTTMVGTNAANLTIALRTETGDDMEPEATTGTITGTVTGWDLLEEPSGPTEFRIAVVGFAVSGLGSPDSEIQQPEEGDQMPANVTSDAPMAGTDYSLLSRTGDFALYVLAGVIDAESESLEITHIGLRRGISLEEGQTLDEIDLAISTPLDQPVSIEVEGAPEGMEVGTFLAMNLGDDGIVPLPMGGDGPGIAGLPAATGPFADVIWDVFAGGGGEDCAAEGPCDTWELMSLHRNVPVGQLEHMVINDIPSLPEDLEYDAATETFSFTASGNPDVVASDLRTTDSSDERRLWNFVIFDGSTSFRIPEFAASRGWGGLEDEFFWKLDLMRFNNAFDPNEFVVEEVFEIITGMASRDLSMRAN